MPLHHGCVLVRMIKKLISPRKLTKQKGLCNRVQKQKNASPINVVFHIIGRWMW